MQILHQINRFCQSWLLKNKPEQKQEEEHIKLWDKISGGYCPQCQSKTDFYTLAEGGLALNIECTNCSQKYWITPYRDFGVRYID